MKLKLIQWLPKGRLYAAESHHGHVIVIDDDLSWFRGDTANIIASTESAQRGVFEGRSVSIHALYFSEPVGMVYFIDGDQDLRYIRDMCGLGYTDGFEMSPADDLRSRVPKAPKPV